ncbi:MAG: hypothetical protein ACM31O_14020 [Bacteroidota bacterium]
MHACVSTPGHEIILQVQRNLLDIAGTLQVVVDDARRSNRGGPPFDKIEFSVARLRQQAERLSMVLERLELGSALSGPASEAESADRPQSVETPMSAERVRIMVELLEEAHHLLDNIKPLLPLVEQRQASALSAKIGRVLAGKEEE